jgi:hypothetical protein
MTGLPTDVPPWRIVTYDLHAMSLANGARALFRLAIEPACTAVAAELAATPRGPETSSIDQWDDLRDTQLELHRSFALTLGGLW